MDKSSYGWFMGYKLHMRINTNGEIMSITITKANRSDLSKGLVGKLSGDKGHSVLQISNT